MSRTIYTIGHSNHSQDAFLNLLRANGIEVLVDTRSAPYSKYATQFNAPELKPTMAEEGISYIYLGFALGGKPRREKSYDTNEHALYDRIARTESFRLGIAELEGTAERHRVAIMCAEENPTDCHRRLLIGEVLQSRGYEIRHIRGNGRIQTEAELRSAHEFAHKRQPQFALFAEERASWKYTRLVSPRKAQSSSLKP